MDNIEEIIKQNELIHGKLFRIDVKHYKKEYFAYFRYPKSDDYKKFWDSISNGKSNIDVETTLLKDLFIFGFDELIDFENKLYIFNIYKDKLSELFRLSFVEQVSEYQVPEKYRQGSENPDEFLYLKVLDGETELYGVFKTPGFKIYSKVQTAINKKQQYSAIQELSKGCFKTGDTVLLDFESRPELFSSYKHIMLELFDTYNEEVYEQIENYFISDLEGEDILLKQKALILANLGVDTTNLDDEVHFAHLWNYTLYILKHSPKISQ